MFVLLFRGVGGDGVIFPGPGLFFRVLYIRHTALSDHLYNFCISEDQLISPQLGRGRLLQLLTFPVHSRV